MSKLLVVDGMNLLFRMFYGMPARIVNADGKAIQGTLGFVGALLKILRAISPTHVAVIFDGECENERRDIDKDYKANRPDYSQMAEDELPFSQLPDVYAALDLLGIRYFETTVCETDDVIASYAYKYGEEHDIVICSQDSDFFQLISERVSVLHYRGDASLVCTPDYIRERLGIEPSLYADYKSLTGDNADNIKGAQKVGPKTAAALVNEFGTLDSIIAHASEIKKPSVRESIERDGERLLRNYSLIKLSDSATLPFELCEIKYSYSGITTTEVLQGIGLR
jgi:DNA polymerase-1